MEFSRQEYWSGLPFPSSGDLPDQGIEPGSPGLHLGLLDCTWVSWIAGRFFTFWTTAAAKSLQSCPTLCDPIDGSPPGSPVPGILQARTLEWGAISFSSVSKWEEKVKSLSCVRLFMTPWTAAHLAPPSMGFSRQEYWSGVPFPSPSEPLGSPKWAQNPHTQRKTMWQRLTIAESRGWVYECSLYYSFYSSVCLKVHII